MDMGSRRFSGNLIISRSISLVLKLVSVKLGVLLFLLHLAGGQGIDAAAQHQQHDKFVLIFRTFTTSAALASAVTAASSAQAPALNQPSRTSGYEFHGFRTFRISRRPGPHRARRGQATDPHSIAELVRRERIAGRMKALQELVPSCNKTDRAAMLDEIVDYVKYLRLQVKVLSMSRLGRAGAVAQLVADVPNLPPERALTDDGQNRPAWEKWTTVGTEQELAKLMEEDAGAAMQFLQSKVLCIMPLSLASAIFLPNQPDKGL